MKTVVLLLGALLFLGTATSGLRIDEEYGTSHVRGGAGGRRGDHRTVRQRRHRNLEIRKEAGSVRSTPTRDLMRRRPKTGRNRPNRNRKNRNRIMRMVTPAPTTTPDTYVEIILRRYLLEGGDEFIDPDSYQTCALRRTEQQIGIDLMPESKIVQYYALYCIFCATNAKPNDYTGLDAIVAPWSRRRNWEVNDTDPCDDWFGIGCNRMGEVTDIELFENDLSGIWPKEVILLACDGGAATGAGRLRRLDLFDNENLSDNFDQSWVPLLGSCMRYLYYGTTSFDAPVPILPSGVIEYDNSFTYMIGPLDDDNFANSLNLEYIVMSNNEFNSSIPMIFGQMANLEELYISNSFVESESLSFMQGMPSIQVVWIDNNPGVTGVLPSFLGSLNTLLNLNVAECSMSGVLPANLANARRLQYLYLYSNQFNGVIPFAYGDIPRLREFRVEDNDITGVMPTSLCARRGASFRPALRLSVLGTDCNGEVRCNTNTCCTCCTVQECGLPPEP